MFVPDPREKAKPSSSAQPSKAAKQLTPEQRAFLKNHTTLNDLELPQGPEQYTKQNFNDEILSVVNDINLLNDLVENKINRFKQLGYGEADATLLADLLRNAFHVPSPSKAKQTSTSSTPTVEKPKEKATKQPAAAARKPAFTEAQRAFINQINSLRPPTLQELIQQGFDTALPQELRKLHQSAQTKKLDNLAAVGDTLLTAADTFVSEELVKQGYSKKDADLIAEWRLALEDIR